jgi:hypothetical protein
MERLGVGQVKPADSLKVYAFPSPGAAIAVMPGPLLWRNTPAGTSSARTGAIKARPMPNDKKQEPVMDFIVKISESK